MMIVNWVGQVPSIPSDKWLDYDSITWQSWTYFAILFLFVFLL